MGKFRCKIFFFHKKNLTTPRLKIKYYTNNKVYLGKKREEREERNGREKERVQEGREKWRQEKRREDQEEKNKRLIKTALFK